LELDGAESRAGPEHAGTGGFWLAAGCASISRSSAKIHKPNHDTMGRSAAPPCRFATSASAHIRSLPRISFTRTARLNRLSAELDANDNIGDALTLRAALVYADGEYVSFRNAPPP